MAIEAHGEQVSEEIKGDENGLGTKGDGKVKGSIDVKYVECCGEEKVFFEEEGKSG